MTNTALAMTTPDPWRPCPDHGVRTLGACRGCQRPLCCRCTPPFVGGVRWERLCAECIEGMADDFLPLLNDPTYETWGEARLIFACGCVGQRQHLGGYTVERLCDRHDQLLERSPYVCPYPHHEHGPLGLCPTHERPLVCGPFDSGICLSCRPSLAERCLVCGQIRLACAC